MTVVVLVGKKFYIAVVMKFVVVSTDVCQQQCHVVIVIPETLVGIIKPARPISFGLLSNNGCLSLVVPGWGVSTRKSCTDGLEEAIMETKKLMALGGCG